MKLSVNQLKRMLSIFVILALLSSTVIVASSVFAGTTGLSVGASASLSYSFSGSNKNSAGFAEGTITLKANSSNDTGTYYLYWADDTKALSGYSEIDKVSATTSGVTTKMFTQTAIPADATKLIAIKSSSEPSDKSVANASAVYTIPTNKRFPYKSSQKNYSFGSISDIHISNDGHYTYDDIHFEKTLDSLADRNVDFIVTGGDNVNNQNGNYYISEWKTYQKILADSDYCNPIYESIGNHEAWSGSNGTKAFVKATGMNGDPNVFNDTSKAYYTFDEPKTGDHFIMMSLSAFNPTQNDEFDTTQLNWVKSLLEKYKGDGHNTYIYEHAGFWKWGVGDDEDDPYYDFHLSLDYSGHKELQNILYNYTDALFFCGHTHIYFDAQYNYMDYDVATGKKTAKMFHNSSVGGIRKPKDITPHMNNLDRTNREDEAEGYIVDCYGDYVVCNGANLYYNKIDPQTTYISIGTGKNDPQPITTTTTVQKTHNVVYNIPNSAYLIPDVVDRTVTQGSSFKCTLKDNSGKTPSDTVKYNKTLKVTMGGVDITSKVVTSTGSDINKSFVINIPSVTGDVVITANCTATTVTTKVTTVTTATTQPTTVTTATTVPPTTTNPPVQYKMGDVNLDNKVNVQDATIIQKSVSRSLELNELQKKLADVTGDGAVNISDVTLLQKVNVGLISFDLPLISVGAGENDLASLITEVGSYLSSQYTYSSYDQYMALKKEYRYCNSNYQGFTTAQANSYYNSLNEKYSALKAIAGEASTTDGVDVYFKNTSNWSTVYAYAWGSAGKNKEWPGVPMTNVTGNIYKIHIDEGLENIIFDNGSSQTKDLLIPGNNQLFDYSTSKWEPYNG